MSGAMRRRLASAGILAALAAAFAPHASAAEAPEWLVRAAASSVPPTYAEAPYVTLLDEETVSIGRDGDATVVRRCAVRIQTPAGTHAANATVAYETSGMSVKGLRAWLLAPGRPVKEYGGGDVVDMAQMGGDVYTEARVRAIVGARDATPGSTFGYECRLARHATIMEYEWAFQGTQPTLCSRFTLDPPPDWNVNALVLNHAAVEPTVTGSARTWEMRLLDEVPDEPMRPTLSALIPRLAVSAVPPDRRAGAIAFGQWDSVAAWLFDLSAAASAPDRDVAAKAGALVAGAKSRVDSIRALAIYVQKMPYASIQMGLDRGGGYRPRPAGQVLARYYGDCKDKANLLCAMLRSLGVPAYLLVIRSDDPTYVREEWPGVHPFNHCIAAIAAPGLEGPVFEHARLGRLVAFDPTDPSTPLGELPQEEQGGVGLLVTREPGAEVRMPVFPEEHNRIDRSQEVTLSSDGNIRGVVQERSYGSSGSSERGLYQSLPLPRYRDLIRRWLSDFAPRASVNAMQMVEQDSAGAFQLEVDYSAERYGQAMDRMILFRPTLAERIEAMPIEDAPRRAPIEIRPVIYRERSRFHLPTGYAVDDAPAAVHLTASFGTYDWEVERDAPAGELRLRRELTLRRAMLEPGDYPMVRSFFEKVRAAEQARVVLARP